MGIFPGGSGSADSEDVTDDSDVLWQASSEESKLMSLEWSTLTTQRSNSNGVTPDFSLLSSSTSSPHGQVHSNLQDSHSTSPSVAVSTQVRPPLPQSLHVHGRATGLRSIFDVLTAEFERVNNGGVDVYRFLHGKAIDLLLVSSPEDESEEVSRQICT